MARLAPRLTYYVGDWLDNPTDNTLIYGHLRASNAPSLRHGVVLDASVRYLSTAKVTETQYLQRGTSLNYPRLLAPLLYLAICVKLYSSLY